MNLNLTLILVHRSGTAPSFADKSIQWIEGSFTEDFLPEWAAPDIIIHAASPSNQMSIFTDPTGTVNCNILATNYLLECAHKYNSCFLFFSSGAVYQAQSKPLAEYFPLLAVHTISCLQNPTHSNSFWPAFLSYLLGSDVFSKLKHGSPCFCKSSILLSKAKSVLQNLEVYKPW